MALFGKEERLVCKCGGAIFTEEDAYVYDKNSKVITRTSIGKMAKCVECGNLISMVKDNYFRDATIKE